MRLFETKKNIWLKKINQIDYQNGHNGKDDLRSNPKTWLIENPRSITYIL